MEASSSSGRIGGKWPGQAFSGRRAGIAIAVISAVLAGVLLYLFVQQNQTNSSPAAVAAASASSVVIATGYIPTGTPASQIASAGALQHSVVPVKDVQAGAITDSAQVVSEVATKDIYPGQQIVASDFAAGDVAIGQYLSANQRAIEIPISAVQGLQGYVEPGARVDILSSANTANGGYGTLAADVLVLSVGTGTNGTVVGSGSGSYVFAVSSDLASKIALASDGSKLWILLRPPVWSRPTTSSTTGVKK